MNQMETIQQLEQENAELKEEIKKLNDTVTWMHDTIWTLIKRNGAKNGV